MGIVLKQTLKGSIYAYIGVILGGINVAILFPIIFSEEEVGLINILITVSAISAQFASLGSAGIINYFFPKFRNLENAHNSFFNFIFLFSSIGFLVFTIIFYFFGDLFLSTKDVNITLQQEYYPFLYPLTFFTIGFIVVDMFSSSTYNSSIGNLYKDVVVRVVIFIISILFLYQVITFKTFIWLYTLNLGIPVIALLIVLIKKHDIDFKMPKVKVYKPHFGKIVSVGFFYILSGLSDILASYIDKYMISYFLGLKATGVYSITNYFGTLTKIPRSSMGKIGTPVIAKLLDENKHNELSVLLKKSSISQLLFGGFIFINIWTNIDLILSVLPSSYASGKWVVFFISLSHIFYCFMGLGGVTLKVSKYYKIATLFTVVLGVLVVVLNLVLIPVWGINGAALSTALSKLVYVIIILTFLALKFKVKVLFKESISIVISGLIALYISQLVPGVNAFKNIYIEVGINIIIKSIICSLLYLLILRLTGVLKNKNQIKSLF